MTPMEKHQSQVAARVLEELKKRSMEGYYCRTAQEAADLVSSPTLPLYKKRIFQKCRIHQHFWKICLK